MDAYRNREGCSKFQIGIMENLEYCNFNDRYCRESYRFISFRFINERSTLKSVNMVAVGIFIGANIIFIIGFAILFVCQKRILTKASFPNLDPI